MVFAAKYHISCLVQLYNKARKLKSGESKLNNNEQSFNDDVFAELVMHIEEIYMRIKMHLLYSSLLIFLSDLYSNRLIELVYELDRVYD